MVRFVRATPFVLYLAYATRAQTEGKTMAKPKTWYTYTAPDGFVDSFQSTMEINFVALVQFPGEGGRWALVKKSKRHIPNSALGQSGEQSRYLASLPHVNVPVVAAEPKASKYIQDRLGRAIFGK